MAFQPDTNRDPMTQDPSGVAAARFRSGLGPKGPHMTVTTLYRQRPVEFSGDDIWQYGAIGFERNADTARFTEIFRTVNGREDYSQAGTIWQVYDATATPASVELV